MLNGNQSVEMDFDDNFIQIINGKSAATEKTRHGINPATLEPKAPVPIATPDDLVRAVSAARTASKTWSKTPYETRQDAVLAFANAFESLRTSFRDLLVSEQGKPIAQAESETDAAAVWLKGMTGIPLPEDVVEDTENRTVTTRYTPVGVVAAIVPWNFPLMLAAGKISPALLTGNVIIVKPPPFTPYCGLKLVELAQKFFPPGVIQSLSGDENLGPWLTAHPGIDKISFTGSTHTGKAVLQSAGNTLKRVTLELGGNDPAIVFPDVDVDKVAQQVATWAFLNSGQVCLNLKRIYAHASIFEEFKRAMVKYAGKYAIGDGSKPGVTNGPIQNRMQYDRVKTFFDDIAKQGWEVALGGNMDETPQNGYFVKPTIIDRPLDNSRIVVEEPFGPIVPLLSWEEEEDVISRANDTAMGLGASVWSNDIARASRVAREIQAGSVWINWAPTSNFLLWPLSVATRRVVLGLNGDSMV